MDKIKKRELSINLKNALAEQNMSQSELARATGMERDRISKYARGATFPNPPALKKIADALHIPVDELAPSHPHPSAAPPDVVAPLSYVQTDTKTGWITVNRRVSTATALKIIQLLEQDNDSSACPPHTTNLHKPK